jgi:hypothetical protein
MRSWQRLAVGAALGLAGVGGGCELIEDFGNPKLGNPEGTGGSGATSSSTTGSTSSTTVGTSTTGTGGAPGSKVNGATCTAGEQCKSGACVDDGQGSMICCATACGGGFACAEGGTCATSCSTSGGCATGYACGMAADGGAGGGAGVCLLANGQPCTQTSQCASTYCADGVCCNEACNATACYACAAKLTTGVDGTCSPAKDGTVDPRGMCLNDTSRCMGDNTCVGGFCNQHTPAGTVCGGTCSSVDGEMTLALCSDAGACDVPAGTVACPIPQCENMEGFNACACSKDSDCPAQLPHCYIDPVAGSCIAPPCGTGMKCCLSSGCMPDSTVCITGWCAANSFP